MSKPAARVGDMHTCPMVTPGVPPVPHVGGPILPPGCPTVLIGGLPAARVGDMALCVGPPDSIVMGSPTVLIGGLPAARMGDPTAHGGVIVLGLPTVLIGESGGGGGGGAGGGGGGGAGGGLAAGSGAAAAAGPAAASAKAHELEALDGGHSLARHGPEVSDAALEARLRTGIAPDGRFYPCLGSTRFKSYEAWVATRDAAVREIVAREGINLEQPPGPGQKKSYTAVKEHDEPIDDGFVGRRGTERLIKDPASGDDGDVFSQIDPVRGLTRTKTRLSWSPSKGRWVVKQHYPDARGWDGTKGEYSGPP